ncbi:MAG: hypothetical protein U0836_17810 [Pirellulales bacterium]
MSEPRVEIELEGTPRGYRPGELLRGQFLVEAPNWTAAEVSVLWYTEGKGDEDMGVHYFERIDREESDLERDDEPQPFMALLPASPLSYRGAILSIRWCVRVRVFLERDREVVGELPFMLGSVPSGRLVSP